MLDRKITVSWASAVSCLLILGAPRSGAQSAAQTLADSVIWLNHGRLKPLLAQPGGLAQAASQAGHLIIKSYSAPVNSMNLPQLSAAASAIALCKILGRTTAADNTTNIVTSHVHLRVDEVLSGALPREVFVDVPGGTVIFGPDAVAEVRTPEAAGLPNGAEVLIFLSVTGSLGTFSPTNGVEGIFWVNLPDGQLISATKYDPHPHLVKSVSGTLAAIRSQLLDPNAVQ